MTFTRGVCLLGNSLWGKVCDCVFIQFPPACSWYVQHLSDYLRNHCQRVKSWTWMVWNQRFLMMSYSFTVKVEAELQCVCFFLHLLLSAEPNLGPSMCYQMTVRVFFWLVVLLEVRCVKVLFKFVRVFLLFLWGFLFLGEDRVSWPKENQLSHSCCTLPSLLMKVRTLEC